MNVWLTTVMLISCGWSSNSFVLQPVVSNIGISNHVPRFDGKQFGRYQQAEISWTTHPALTRQRRSVAAVQTQGLFGLGGLEIAVILIVVGFIIGPQKLGEMAGQFKGGLDDVPDELKKIPQDFMKGVEEGEINARARNAKPMKRPPKKDDE